MFKNKNKPWDKKKREVLKMDRKRIKIRQNGRVVNLYGLIQSRNVDTEIYPTLYKYGSLKPLEINQEWLATGLQTLEGIKDIDKLAKEAENLFLELPDEIQNLYGKSYAEFAKDKGQKIIDFMKQKEQKSELNNNTNDIADNTKNN